MVYVEISETIWKDSLKSSLLFDGKCVTQAVGFKPTEVILRQACFLFFKNFSRSNRKIRSPTILFLTLILGTDQVSEALRKTELVSNKTSYIVKCCLCDREMGKVRIQNDNERLVLTANALASV
ncbi:hypothetical protein [Candidatus Acidianus copahuensis]|uniref:hypothetical protein n=1 Tax=Candidatus Acidianus copahuensis TaxID=1160895 RepID=UPI00064E62C9|nr:hypothetical protein [Candidatus Acidianus copahuensis]